jgi:hypothetical protein
MKFGFTFIERGENGSVENGAFETFDSFQQCCTVAEKASESNRSNVLTLFLANTTATAATRKLCPS